jgi:hypothetical protein
MIGSDDVLACFIAGNTFTWDDWFRLETMDDSFQPTIDMLLNVSIFIWFGAVCPWRLFAHSPVISIYRLIPLGILVLLFRRLPIIFALHKSIHQIEQRRQALFVGFFGPIGVSAIFYLYVSLEFLEKVEVDGEVREDAAFLMEVMNVVIWFLVICSVVSLSIPFIPHGVLTREQIVHGLSIPMGKLGFHGPRVLSTALSFARTGDESEGGDAPPFHVQDGETRTDAEARLRRRPGWSRNGGDSLPNRVVRIGRTLISSGTSSASTSRATSQAPLPLSSVPTAVREEGKSGSEGGSEEAMPGPGEGVLPGRTIRFHDEQQADKAAVGRIGDRD